MAFLIASHFHAMQHLSGFAVSDFKAEQLIDVDEAKRLAPWLGRGQAPYSGGSAYLFAPRFLWECLNSRTVSWVPAPASSNPSCRFPAMGLPAGFRSRVM